MLAHQQGNLLNQARLASALGVAAPAITRYIERWAWAAWLPPRTSITRWPLWFRGDQLEPW
ncbi:MAG: hypothetical protein IPI20_15750 [Rhodoferax sp.]|nr:hypothetical protein [Rhodoferax sp.]